MDEVKQQFICFICPLDRISRCVRLLGRRHRAVCVLCLIFELQVVEVAVRAAQRHESVVVALLGDLTVGYHSDGVGVFHGREAVSYHNGGAPTAQLVKGGLDEEFCGVVKGRGCFVQN